MVQAYDWQTGLTETRAEIADHLKKQGIQAPASAADLQRLRQEAAEAAAAERHNQGQG